MARREGGDVWLHLVLTPSLLARLQPYSPGFGHQDYPAVAYNPRGLMFAHCCINVNKFTLVFTILPFLFVSTCSHNLQNSKHVG